MRCVVFDPLDLEALTVIDVPQEFIRRLEQERGFRYIRFAIPSDFDFRRYDPSEPPRLESMRIAEVRMERFFYGNVSTWSAMAMNPEICLLMKSELLPGQRREDQERQKKAFVSGILKAWGALE